MILWVITLKKMFTFYDCPLSFQIKFDDCDIIVMVYQSIRNEELWEVNEIKATVPWKDEWW